MWRKRKETEKGQAIVEFALILPIALLLICAVIDFGWVFTHKLVLSTAVRDGARVGITCSSEGTFDSQVRTRVQNEASICKREALHISPVVRNGDVVVTATYDLDMLTPMAKLFFGSMTYHMQARCTMKAE